MIMMTNHKQEGKSPLKARVKTTHKGFGRSQYFLEFVVVGLLALFHQALASNYFHLRRAIHTRRSNEYTMSEVRKHNTASDCWVVFEDQIYDLTAYAKKHPNGPKDITNLAGTDGTVAFLDIHPPGFLFIVVGDIIGRVAEETPPPTKVPTKSPTKEPTKTPTKEPTKEPTEVPTKEPTKEPTKVPTIAPTKEPTLPPTDALTKPFTMPPTTKIPSKLPSKSPTVAPTTVASGNLPTAKPSKSPTPSPTKRPTPPSTNMPTPKPTTVSIDPIFVSEPPRTTPAPTPSPTKKELDNVVLPPGILDSSDSMSTSSDSSSSSGD